MGSEENTNNNSWSDSEIGGRAHPSHNRRASIDHDSPAVKHILDAAATLFSDKGLHGARIDDIAELANINKSMLYYHIGNKQRIYEVALQRHFQQLADMIEKETEGCEDPIEGLKIILRCHVNNFKLFEDAPRATAHEFACGSRNLTPEAYGHYARMYSFTRRYVQKGIASGVFRNIHPGQVNLMLNGSIFVTVITKSFLENLASHSGKSQENTPTIDDMAEIAFDMVINYLTSKEKPIRYFCPD